MDAIRAGGERRLPERDIVVLADGEDRPPGRVGRGDRGQTVVGAGRQVDHDPIDVRQRRLERAPGPHGTRLGARAAHEPVEPRRPDQVVGEDGDARRQSSVSAR